MKYEMLMMRVLFVVTFALSTALMVAMVVPHDGAMRLAGDAARPAHGTPLSTIIVPMDCPLMADGVVCLARS